MIPRRRTALATAATAALLLTAAPAGAGSTNATASGEELLTYLTGGKLKPSKRFAYQVICAADCSLSATAKVKVKGGSLGPIVSTAVFPANQVAEAFIKPNKNLRNAIKANIRTARLITKVTATNLATGEVDVDTRTYRFKR